MDNRIKVGTRDSVLALQQTQWVVEELKRYWPQYDFVIVPMKTKGDKILDVALAKIGDKGLFTKELETALLAGEIDLAVHSMKDLPTKLPQGLIISAMTERHDPRDVLVSTNNYNLQTLPPGAKIGTSSLRRRAQLLHKRPDLRVEDLRGNINTRLAKLEKEGFAAIMLAAAGLSRLGLEDRISTWFSPEEIVPAVGQGSIGVESRENDERITEIVAVIDHWETRVAITAERAFLRTLEGGCQIPIGAYGEVKKEGLVLTGVVASLDGTRLIRQAMTDAPQNAPSLGEKLAELMRSQGAQEILNQVLQEIER
ncbi:hydroxymethylbilane synthase [Thermanaerosceptrum fracticalcis]|uniref:Porphobilinogen deaminase n=1 Tax=Thermanaerosceptrum fracticalcis TaxID=1712410 RepID=A0A7G6E1D6_THEFR|nr:hydroxymethylbilane synthase [Thermanaerosceptrum fracticalcis]QNB45890.1 hydroxymethylbilane synthase [Thermanaerosceptrum fracticalcis]